MNSLVYAVQCPSNVEGTGGIDTTNIPPYPTLGTYTEYKAVPSSCYCLGTTSIVTDDLSVVQAEIDTACSSFYSSNLSLTYTGKTVVSSSSTSIVYQPQPLDTITETGALTCEVIIDPFAQTKIEQGAYNDGTIIHYVQNSQTPCPSGTTYEQTFTFNHDTDKTCLVTNTKTCPSSYYYDTQFCQPQSPTNCPDYICPDGFKLRDIIPQDGSATISSCDNRPPLKNCSDLEPYLLNDVCPEDQNCTDAVTCEAYSRANDLCPNTTDTFTFNYVNQFNYSRTCTAETGDTIGTTENESNNATNIVDAVNRNRNEIKDTINSLSADQENRHDQQQIIISDTRTLTAQIASDIEYMRNNQLSSDIQLNQLLIQETLDSKLSAIKNALENGNGTTQNNTGIETRIDSTNTLLTDIKESLDTTSPTESEQKFDDVSEELTAKKTEFSDAMSLRKDEILALFDVNNITFSGSLPDTSIEIMGKTLTIDTQWIEYVLAFLGILIVFYAYYDALIIVIGG